MASTGNGFAPRATSSVIVCRYVFALSRSIPSTDPLWVQLKFFTDISAVKRTGTARRAALQSLARHSMISLTSVCSQSPGILN